ncbi:hypothetical protein [Alloyangia pacifica]|uniref:Uncharacterized protein n=1 Tax=Alloyangia pacifica TaxID=311180 RepID=A0A1I6VT29_9RHOB|nr:hypothetical protein [Alloyangia pacifica]SDI13363.1 hypothetical protein SAMN04488245_112213 [Alloyangia pacifica]SFT16751.1 hypothetical protein SAMN04488050_112213 [Alloyangia pacifica]
MYLNKSFGRKRFKASLGNANHLIITSLVGLDAIERGIVDKIPKEMRTTWSPKSPQNSARRARRLVLDMALIRAVDAVDVYIRDSMRQPTLIQDAILRGHIDRAGRSVFKKLAALEGNLHGLDPLLCALIAVLVSWRNEGAHMEADDTLSAKQRATIDANREIVAARFSGLDADILLSDYDSENPPTFKEVASLINASHHFVEDLEGQLFKKIDPETYLRQLVKEAIRPKIRDRSASTKKGSEIAAIWGRSPTDRPRYVRSLLQHQGLSEKRAKSGPSLEFNQEAIERLTALDPKGLNRWLSE